MHRHWKLLRSLFVAVVITFLMQGLEYRGWFAGPDGNLINGVLSGRVKPEEAGDQSITILEIDQKAYESPACFDNTSPLKPALIMNLVKKALRAGPRVAGVNIFTEGELYRKMVLRPSDPTVVWMSGSEMDSSIETPAFWGWLWGAHDQMTVKPGKVLGDDPFQAAARRGIHWAVPVFPRDSDSLIRRFPRRVEVANNPGGPSARDAFPSWATQVAQEYCRGGAYCTDEAAEEIYVSYSGGRPPEIKLSDYLACKADSTLTWLPNKQAEFSSHVQGKALLIGGTFQPSGQGGNFYETPGGLLPGIMINAYAVRAEIEGRGLHEVRQPWSLILDLAIGGLIVLIFEHEFFIFVTRKWAWMADNEFRCMIAASVFILFASWTLTWLILPAAAYVSGVAGVILGVLLHQVTEVFFSNPKPR